MTSATGGSALGVVLAYLLNQVPFVASAPSDVQAALFVVVAAVATFAAGYLKHEA